MTSDSMSARPMIIEARIDAAALGFLAMPSTDAAIARACPIAPAAAAIPRTNAAETRPQRTPCWLAPDNGAERAEDPQRHHRPRPDHRHQAHEDPGGGVLPEDVPEETHPQREDAREVADHLDDEHDRRQPHHRPEEVLEIAQETLPANAFEVV